MVNLTGRRNPILAALAIAGLVAGCGGGSSSGTTSTAQTPPVTTATQTQTTTTAAPSGKAAAAIAGYRKYLTALNAKDGATVCQLLVPDGTTKLRPPAKRETCAEGVTASIGHPNAGGLKWASARIEGTPVGTASGNSATLEVTVASTYSDGMTEPQHETVKMSLLDREWRLVEPDETLYRAIGQK